MKSRLKVGGAFAAAFVALVAGHEGLRTTAYRDVVGVPTICYGETKNVKMGDKKTVAECKELLKQSLDKHAYEMEKALKSPDSLPDKVYIAFGSLTYNIGATAFKKSSVAKYANQGDLKKACDSILLYNKGRVNGKLQVIKGLDNRRKDEHKICLEGVKEGTKWYRFW